ncbi:triose-phosphate isomerase [Candidatus Babeliales bacterium]|nr:triose-phosphate isomerase [Candidatus Babeliales bacterium]MBP9843376.1 triose-phosphate isomerase [Candidatus Babeliales bacterium]
MIKNYYFGNWKMYQSFSSIKKFLKEYKADKAWQQGFSDRYVGIAASYEQLSFLQQKLKKSSLLVGSQDCSQFIQGAFTGQVSVQSLAEMNVSFCIVGHSEARLYLGQSDEQIALKFKMLLAANISPILCIGDTLAQKEQGLTLQVLFDQLEAILGFLQSYHGTTKIFIAYEPIYAIGTGIVPTKNELQDVFSFLQQLCKQVSVAKNLLLLYGGSVSDRTITNLQGIDGISGFLIGKSSINFQDLKKIVES